MPIVYKGTISDPERDGTYTFAHWRTKGSKNGVRVWQNEDGSYTEAGRNFKPGGRYNQSDSDGESRVKSAEEKAAAKAEAARQKNAAYNEQIAKSIPYSRDDLSDYEKQQELAVMTAQLKYADAMKEYQKKAEETNATKMKDALKKELTSQEAKLILGVGVAALAVGGLYLAGGQLDNNALSTIIKFVDPTGAAKLAGQISADPNTVNAVDEAADAADAADAAEAAAEGAMAAEAVDDLGEEPPIFTSDDPNAKYYDSSGKDYARNADPEAAAADAAYRSEMEDFDSTVARSKKAGTEIPKAEDRWDYDERVKNGEDVGKFSDYWDKRQSGEIDGRLPKQETASTFKAPVETETTSTSGSGSAKSAQTKAADNVERYTPSADDIVERPDSYSDSSYRDRLAESRKIDDRNIRSVTRDEFETVDGKNRDQAEGYVRLGGTERVDATKTRNGVLDSTTQRQKAASDARVDAWAKDAVDTDFTQSRATFRQQAANESSASKTAAPAPARSRDIYAESDFAKRVTNMTADLWSDPNVTAEQSAAARDQAYAQKPAYLERQAPGYAERLADNLSFNEERTASKPKTTIDSTATVRDEEPASSGAKSSSSTSGSKTSGSTARPSTGNSELDDYTSQLFGSNQSTLDEILKRQRGG